jgi:hydroxymethylpyrimidine pyrophosphatase-like HAD family hydrolase
MDPLVVRDLVAVARRGLPQILVSCEILDRWCTDRFDETYTTETGRLFRPDVVAPLETFCVEPVTKLMLLGEPRIVSGLESIYQRIAPDAGVTVIRSDPDLIQIMHASASKGVALRLVAEHYAIPLSQVMAIGDAVNDIPMLREAGVAVAMDNAHPLVKQAAHWTAPSNNDHGVHAALVRYGLCD